MNKLWLNWRHYLRLRVWYSSTGVIQDDSNMFIEQASAYFALHRKKTKIFENIDTLPLVGAIWLEGLCPVQVDGDTRHQ